MAEGNTHKAETEIARLGNSLEYRDDYDYMVAVANMYRQRQDTLHALSSFAQASSLAGRGDEESLTRTQYELAEQEGRQINHHPHKIPRDLAEGPWRKVEDRDFPR